MAKNRLIGAIDQGTSSSRFFIFNVDTGEQIVSHQIELEHHYPEDGWVEMDANKMFNITEKCIELAVNQLTNLGHSIDEIKAVGITNQRVIWDKITGEPLLPAILWLDSRTTKLAEQMIAKTKSGSKDHYQSITGLHIHPYFSALKIKWMLDNVPTVKAAVQQGTALFGTVDTWLIWKLTGGTCHVTDVTNASRTLLMDITSCTWSSELCSFFGIPQKILPEIHSSAEIYGRIRSGTLKEVSISGCLGDQQSALVGQNCLVKGDVKNTYGTGTFLLFNTGPDLVLSKNGLLSTVAFQFGPEQPVFYALEGAASIGGTGVRWLRDNLSIIQTSNEVETLARSVDDTCGVHFVPCFFGLYTPYWDPTARGIICGLTSYSTKAHLARATLEAVCFTTVEILEAIHNDTDTTVVSELKIDGGMTNNNLLAQMQADLLGMDVVRAEMVEITAWGAAIAAAVGIGLFSLEEYRQMKGRKMDRFQPTIEKGNRHQRLLVWKKAVQRARNWAV